jgi:NADH-quinone oxidoreductase subunit J
METVVAGIACESGCHEFRHCLSPTGETRMSLPFVLFFVFAAIAVAGAVLLILAREPIHSALSLILVMVALAALYLLLGAEFIAAVQIIVYAGAVMVLFVFVIMLLNAGVEERTDWSKMAKYAGLPLGLFLLLELAHWLAHSEAGVNIASGVGSNGHAASTRDLSVQLFQQYLFPFEVTSILILIAILGALVLAKRGE